MAKIKFGMMMTDARGKLGGQVFSKNRGGAYVRTKSTPTNPNSLSQADVRSIFGSISAGWSGLTAQQRATWNEAVDDFKQTDVFGDLKTPSGKALYQRLNQNLLLSGQSILNVAPGLEDAPINATDGVEIDKAAKEIALANLPSVAGVYVVIRASGSVTQGTSNVKNQLRVISYQQTVAVTDATTYTAYVDKFGTPASGQKIIFDIAFILPNGVQTPSKQLVGEFI